MLKRILKSIFKNSSNVQTITINGKTFHGSGNVVVHNNRVIVDGNDLTPDAKNIEISIQGDVEYLTVDCCSKISITGNVNECESTSGDIECGDVFGNIKTTSGDVKCGNVQGAINTTSGDIKHRKN